MIPASWCCGCSVGTESCQKVLGPRGKDGKSGWGEGTKVAKEAGSRPVTRAGALGSAHSATSLPSGTGAFSTAPRPTTPRPFFLLSLVCPAAAPGPPHQYRSMARTPTAAQRTAAPNPRAQRSSQPQPPRRLDYRHEPPRPAALTRSSAPHQLRHRPLRPRQLLSAAAARWQQQQAH